MSSNAARTPAGSDAFPLPAAAPLEDAAIPSVDRIVDDVARLAKT